MKSKITGIELYKMSRKKETVIVVFLFLFSGITTLILSYRDRADFALSVYWVLLSYMSMAYKFALPASLCLLMASTIVGENTSGNLKTLIHSVVRRETIYLSKFVSHVGLILLLNFAIILVLYAILFFGFDLALSPMEFRAFALKLFYYNIYIVTLSAMLLVASMFFKTSMNAMVSLFVVIFFIKTVSSIELLPIFFVPFLKTWNRVGQHLPREFIWFTLSVYSLLTVVSIILGLYKFSRYRVLS